MKKNESYILRLTEDFTRSKFSFNNLHLLLFLLILPSILTILTYNQATRFLPYDSGFIYIAQTTNFACLTYLLFILIITLFNIISGKKMVRKEQFKLIFTVSVLSFLWQSFAFDYFAAIIRSDLMSGAVKDFDRMGTTWNRLIVSFLVLALPFITLLVNYLICFLIPKYTFNFDWFKKINPLQIFGLVILVFLTLSVFDMPQWTFVLISLIGFIFLLENQSYGNRFIAVIFGVIIFNLFYRPEIESLSGTPIYLRLFSNTMGRLLKTDNFKNYWFIWDYLIYFGFFALIVYLFFYLIKSNTILDAVYATLGIISLIYFDFITYYFVMQSTDLTNPLAFISRSDYLTEFGEAYSYDIPYILLFFLIGIIYLVRLAYVSIPKSKNDTKYSNLSLASFLIAPFGLITTGSANLVSIVLAHLARAELNRSNGNLRGSGLTVFALSFFYIAIAFFPLTFGIFN